MEEGVLLPCLTRPLKKRWTFLLANGTLQFYQRCPRPQGKFNVQSYRAYLRKTTEISLARLGPAPLGILESYHDIEMRDGFASSLKVLKPASGPPGPLMVVLFGGGFIAGDNDQCTETARICVQLFGATAVNVSYRVAPEHKFPVQQLDCLDSLEWIADNATGDVIASDPSKGFVLGGVSAGASIASALSRRFQEDKLAHILTGTTSEQCVTTRLSHVNICSRPVARCAINHGSKELPK